MYSIGNYIVMSISIIFIIAFGYYFLRVHYKRYFSSHSKNLQIFLKENNYELVIKRTINEKEWSNAPIKKLKNKNIEYGFRFITTKPIFLKRRDVEYSFILVKSKNNYVEYWQEITYDFIFDPQIKYTKGKSFKKLEAESTKICNGCNTELNNLLMSCPVCKMEFE